ncbi:MAG: 23S rRNA (guanosine(2251)-2'-O)-methyltransferase RlmB [Geobacter sp.]|nr:23S rRNA (guanosine(2251)-2'-O)-methyltransferase RlmB [Geobacter sp.]
MKEEIVYGINSVLEALRGKRRAFELFVAREGQDKRLEKILALVAEKGVAVRQRDKRDIARLCGTEHHQGVALRVEGFAYTDLEDMLARWRETGEPGLLVLLDGIQDPHNLGAIIRTAACAGAHGVIIPTDRAAQVTAAVEKVSAGAVETVPVARVTNLVQAIETLKEAGFWVYGAVGEAADQLYRQNFSGNVVLVIGAEDEGIRPLVRKKCDLLLSVPLHGGVSSLNASVAAGVMLFEVVRQRIGRDSASGR